MTDWTKLPKWVWGLLEALEDYEDEHPPLYRLTTDSTGDVVYERVECFGKVLDHRHAWPPREVRDVAKFRRDVLREAREQAQSTPTRDPDPVAAESVPVEEDV